MAGCPRCRREVLVYRAVAEGADPLVAELETRCVDCDARLDRFGTEPEITDCDPRELRTRGYPDLDRGPTVGLGGCFETRGCEGCPKIGSRPW